MNAHEHLISKMMSAGVAKDGLITKSKALMRRLGPREKLINATELDGNSKLNSKSLLL